MINHASLSESLIDESGFDRCQENTTSPRVRVMDLAECTVTRVKFLWKRDNYLGLFFFLGFGPSSEGKC